MPKWLEPYHFKKGEESPNPNGRPKNQFKRARKEALDRMIESFLYGGPNGMKDLYDAEDVNDVEKFCISIIMRASEKGDAAALKIILDRFIGPVEQPVVLVGSADPVETLAAITDEELERRERLLSESGI